MSIIRKYKRDRYIAFMSLDEKIIREVAKKYGLKIPVHPLSFWGGVHKSRVALKEFPKEAKEESLKWLEDHDMKPISQEVSDLQQKVLDEIEAKEDSNVQEK